MVARGLFLLGERIMNWRFVVSTVAILGQAFSPVLAMPSPPAFENNLTRAITLQGHERDRFTLADRMSHFGVPGVGVAIVDHCRIVDARGFGRATLNGSPVTERTLFQAASLSKPLTAVAALRLAEERKLRLDADIGPLLHNWILPHSESAGNGPVTLRQLLGHRAGTNVEGFDGYVPGSPLPTLSQILRGEVPANNDPVRVDKTAGTTFSYSGGGYVVAQALMIGATHQSFPQLMQRLVLDPTGMRSSTYAQPLDAGHARLAAQGTGPDGTPMAMRWHVYPELAPAGLWTTPTDYGRFMIALARSVRGEKHGLLSSTYANQLMARGPGNWGLGVDLGAIGPTRKFSHTGANAGYQSAFVMYPDTCQGAVVMTNGDEGNWLIGEIMRAVGEAYHWPDRKQPIVKAALPLTDEIVNTFVGTYQLRDFPTEKFKISRKADGGLYLAREGHVGRDLLPGDGNRLFSPDSEMSIEAIDQGVGRASTLEIGFGGGKNIAQRLD